MQKVTDLNGNTLTFGPNGITHSAGRSITFVRDGMNRITQITDADGNVYLYALRRQRRPRHLHGRRRQRHPQLLQLEPRPPRVPRSPGNRGVRNTYDANGRLISTTDAMGNTVNVSYDVNGMSETILDRLGHPTVITYDANGNVLTRTACPEPPTTFTYDSVGNELTETDAEGRVATGPTTASTTSSPAPTSRATPTTCTYNTRGQPL